MRATRRARRASSAIAAAHVASSVTRSAASPCQTCGACCAYSAAWPRFSLEDDAALGRIPARFVATDGSGMRCEGERCSALIGEVGTSTRCAIYEARPDVCRACQPGDEECNIARRARNLPEIDA